MPQQIHKLEKQKISLGKNKWWLWPAGCCGGCLVLVIAFFVIGYMLVGKDVTQQVKDNFWDEDGKNIFEQIEEKAVTSKTEDKKIMPTTTPDKVVADYMHFTLGTLVTSDVNYDDAKKLLTPSLRLQFKEDSFVPTTYCISDGPSSVRIENINETEDSAIIKVGADFGEGYVAKWEFDLDLFNGRWEINNIKCLAE